MNSNRNILFFLKIPPPVTGATLTNKRVYDSILINKQFNIRKIPISYSNNLNELGKINIHKLYVFFSTLLKLIKELSLYKPAFVYFQISPLGSAFYRDTLFVLIIKLFRNKILFHLHGKGIKEASRSKIKRIFYKFVFYNSEIICLSKLLISDIENVFKGPIHIINNGVPDIDLKKVLSDSQNHTEHINILFLSNLIKSKGIIDFLEALNILNRKGIDFNASIVGAEGDFTATELNSIIAEANLYNKVKYLGAIYQDEKNEIIAANDVLVFPTKNDIWGNVIIEAMQFGIPVISTIEGAIPEIIDDGVTGFLAEKNSPAQIADKIEILIKNPSLVESMGNAARKKYEVKYTLELFENNMKAVFDKVLQKVNGEKNV